MTEKTFTANTVDSHQGTNRTDFSSADFKGPIVGYKSGLKHVKAGKHPAVQKDATLTSALRELSGAAPVAPQKSR